MKEKKVVFTSQALTIEALISESQGGKGVIVTHPHPLYGGSMHNNVVEAVVRAYGAKGYTTMRFNFRGVGRSHGAYDEGVGEQTDVQEAVAYLRDLGKTSIDLAGYSFGSWVNARCIDRLAHIRRMIMVSPPVNAMDFSFFKDCSRLHLVIASSEDDIAPPPMIQHLLPAWNPEVSFKVIQRADHFYGGKTREIEAIIGHWIDVEA